MLPFVLTLISAMGLVSGQVYELSNDCDQLVFQMDGTRMSTVTTAATITDCASLCFATANCVRYKFADLATPQCDLFSVVTSIRVPRATSWYGVAGDGGDTIPVRGVIGGTAMSTTGPYFYSSDCDNLCVSTTGCVSYLYLAANLWTQGELRGSCTLYSVAPTPNQYVVFTGEASCGMPTTTDTTSSSTMMA